MIKLVVSDMDGTLLQKNNTISKRNLDAIQKLQEHDIDFVIASGRDYHSIRLVLDCYDLQFEAILGNGAQYCSVDGSVQLSCYLNKQLVGDVVQVFEEETIPYIIYATDGFYTMMDTEFVKQQFIDRLVRKFGVSITDFEPGGLRHGGACMLLQKLDELSEFLNCEREILKVEAFSAEKEISGAFEKLKMIDGISYMSSFRDNVEVTDRYAQKGLILEKIAAMKGLSKDEILVLGDAMNDITLFTQFPKSCAPANAEAEIKKLAAYHVADCMHDGVAEAIDRMLQEKW